MSRLKVVIGDDDIRYRDNLAAYFMENYRHRFRLQLFSNQEQFTEYVQSQDTDIDIVLMANEWVESWIHKLDHAMVFILCKGKQIAVKEGFEAINCIDRYRNADDLVCEILRVYADREGTMADADLGRGRIESKISVFVSSSGGIGRTTVSLGLSALLGRKKRKTLYLNLDRSGVEWFAFDKVLQAGMSDIVYAIKARPEKLGMKLEAIKQFDERGRFSFYAPVSNPLDVDELSIGELDFFIQKLKNLGVFDDIVIDTHSGISMWNKVLLEIADSIFILSECSETEIGKLIILKEQLDKIFLEQATFIYKRCCLVFNRADPQRVFENQRQLNQLSDAFQANMIVLPFCSALTGQYSADIISNLSTDFGTALTALLQMT